MIARKEKELIVFDFENGKRATYNMNTGETIGKGGKPTKNLSSALAGFDIDDVLNSFEDKKYGEFLMYVKDHFTPRTYRYYGDKSRVSNLGTLLKYANDYKIFEQYFIAGIDADKNIRTPIKDVPKGLLKLCREHNKQIDDYLIDSYKKMPNEYNTIFKMEFENIDDSQKWDIVARLQPTSGYWSSASQKLLFERKYNFQSLMKYIDYLCTFEGLTANSNLIREIGDYANMMSQISEKYEKYPRYFLSTHAIASRNYNRLKQQFSDKLFAKRITPEYEITYKDYKFFYPRCTQDIKDEAVQQSNCVASYIDRVIQGDCHILFLRKENEPTKSLVTIEVRNGKIVQAFQKYNTPCTEEQKEAIAAFNKKFSKE